MCDAVTSVINTSFAGFLDQHLTLIANTSIITWFLLHQCAFKLVPEQTILYLADDCTPVLPLCGSTLHDQHLTLTTWYNHTAVKSEVLLWWFQYGEVRLEAYASPDVVWITLTPDIAVTLPPLPFDQDVVWRWNWSVSDSVLTLGYNEYRATLRWPPRHMEGGVSVSCGLAHPFHAQLVSIDAIKSNDLFTLIPTYYRCNTYSRTAESDPTGVWSFNHRNQTATAVFSTHQLQDCAKTELGWLSPLTTFVSIDSETFTPCSISTS